MRVIFVIVLLILVVIICARTPTPREEVRCWPQSSLLSGALFPRGTRVGRIMSPLPDSTIYSAGRPYYMDRGIASHHVQRNSTFRSARSEYDSRNGGQAFGLTSDWTTPPELIDALPTADQRAISCGVTMNTPMCKAIAQYENYFVYFNIHTYPEDIEIAQVADLLASIDQTMESCLTAAE